MGDRKNYNPNKKRFTGETKKNQIKTVTKNLTKGSKEEKGNTDCSLHFTHQRIQERKELLQRHPQSPPRDPTPASFSTLHPLIVLLPL